MIFDNCLLDMRELLGPKFTGVRFEAIDDLDAEVKSVRVRLANGEKTTVRTRFIVLPEAGTRCCVPDSASATTIHSQERRALQLLRRRENACPAIAGAISCCVAFQHGWFWYIPLTQELTSVGLVLGREYNEMKGWESGNFSKRMIEFAPMIRTSSRTRSLRKRAPYNQFRTDVDYS